MSGSKVTIENGKLNVPNDPIIPFIEGDGIGPDIWAASVPCIRCGCRKSIWRYPQNPLERSIDGAKSLLIQRANGYRRKPWMPLKNI